MTSHSSISGSSGLLEWPEADAAPPQQRRPTQARAGAKVRRVAAVCARLPTGALVGGLFAGLIHLVVSIWIVPHPVAREALRDKIVALTRHCRPWLIIAGDSRAERQLMPEVVAVRVRAQPDAVINIATGACESSAVLAAYREFSARFAPKPIMVISVSIFSVNDRATGPNTLGNEALWALGFVDRLRLVTFSRAVKAAFLSERELYRRFLARPSAPPSSEVPDRGFLGITEQRCLTPTPQRVQPSVAYVDRTWFNRAVIDGVRWRQFEADLGDLIDAGVQVVVLDAPEHPSFARAIAGTSMESPNTRFHRQLVDLCGRLDVPLLRYDAGWSGAHNPDAIFYDVLHLNRRGAALLSQRVGRDLRALIQDGTLRLP